MATLMDHIKEKGVWFWGAVSVLLIVTVLFSSQAFSASLAVTAQPLQNAGNGDLTYRSEYSGASAMTRHESSDLTLNGSDQVTTVDVQGNKASGGTNVKVDLLDASVTLLDTATVALPSAAGAYDTAVTLGAGTVGYHAVTTVLATYTSSGSPAVAVDGAISTLTSDTSPFTWTHTVGSGANRLLVVGVSEADKGNLPSGVTFGAAALTPGPAYTANKSSASLWYLKNPTNSTDTITVTYSQDAADFVGGAINFINVDQTTPVSGSTGTNSNSGTSISVNVTSATDDMVVSVVGVFEDAPTADGTPTPTVH